MEEMIAHYEDTKRNTFFSQLINLKQKGSMAEHIVDYQKLNIRVNDIPQEHRIDVFIGTLNDSIQHEVSLWEPDSLEKAFWVAGKVERKIMARRKSTTQNYKDGSVVAPSLPQPTRLTPQQLEERGVLHKNIITMIICSQYGSIITYTSLLSKSQTLALHVKLCK